MHNPDETPGGRYRAREEVLVGLVNEDEEDLLKGYDPSQRAEILEAMMEDGATAPLTELVPDRSDPIG